MSVPLSSALGLVLPFAVAVTAAPTGSGKRSQESEPTLASTETRASWLDILKRQAAGYKNDPADGTYLSTGAIIAIVVGGIGVLLLVAILIMCGRAGRWPRTVGGGRRKGGHK